ncbi:hypothetical protein D3C71_1949890 [compost metagenome]
MVIKGQIFQTYTEEFKMKAIQTYLTGTESYKVVAEVKYRKGELFDPEEISLLPM